jgi:hypothetical protein
MNFKKKKIKTTSKPIILLILNKKNASEKSGVAPFKHRVKLVDSLR